jgi:dihydropteroate synthase
MPRYRLGDVVHDLTTHTLVMGILNRTPDSFYDHGATFRLDALLRRADELVGDGADLLDIGGVKAGPGPEVDEAEELDRVIPSIEAVNARFDVPVSCDTWRASPAPRARSSATTSAGSPTPTT